MGDSADTRRNTFSSCLHAWWSTKKLADCRGQSLPTDDIRWGLAATNGALHWFHIDSDGFGTYIDVQTGGKLWIVARPRLSLSDGRGYKDFARINLFLEDYDLATPASERWDLEAVFLQKGTRL